MRGTRKWVAAAVVVTMALPAFAVEPARYSPDAGPYRVLTVDHLVLHDFARNKDLPLKIYYPEGVGRFRSSSSLTGRSPPKRPTGRWESIGPAMAT